MSKKTRFENAIVEDIEGIHSEHDSSYCDVVSGVGVGSGLSPPDSLIRKEKAVVSQNRRRGPIPADDDYYDDVENVKKVNQ